MRERTAVTAALALLAALGAGGPARGQVGFVGPGSTPQGDILRGQAAFLNGAGLFNYYTAMGDSINADTLMRVNEYIYQSITHENAEKARRRAADIARRRAHYDAIRDRIENQPEQNDVLKGDALNALFGQLASPDINPSSYRARSFPIPTELVRKIPFFVGPHQATIAMSRITPAGKWPIALRGPEFAPERRRYERALDALFELQLERKTSREALAAVREAVDDLARKLDQVVRPEKETLYLEARNFLKQLATSQEMMKKRDIEMIVAEIDKYSGTTVHDLVVFMQRYNLRFGVPEIGEERAAYPRLYAALREQLDEVRAATGGGGGGGGAQEVGPGAVPDRDGR